MIPKNGVTQKKSRCFPNPGAVHRFYAMSNQKLGMPCLSEMNSVFSRSRSAMRRSRLAAQGMAESEANAAIS